MEAVMNQGNIELLTVDELAAQLKIKKSWLYQRSREKGSDAMPLYRIGKYLRYNPNEVLAWIRRKYGEA